MLLALTAQWRLPIYHLDVKTTFLNGEIKEEVFVQQPERYIALGNEGKVYKLKKTLYGLRQAPRAWYSRIDAHFLHHGFVRSDSENTLYIKRDREGGDMLIVCLYVDNMVYLSNSTALLVKFKHDMMKCFQMTNLGKVNYFIGLEVILNDGEILITQRKYVKDLLKEFNMLNCKPAVSPMNSGEKFILDDGSESIDGKQYRSLVGKLMYVTNTRPDECYVVSVLSRFMNKPSKLHLGDAKRVLRYLAGSTDHGLLYSSAKDGELEGFTDSDWGGSIADRKSTSGLFFKLGNCPVSWSSKK